MALVTYILIGALYSGLHSRFHPEVLGVYMSKALVVVLLDFLFVKGGCYFLNIQGTSQVLDLVAYDGYKFVGYAFLCPLSNPRIIDCKHQSNHHYHCRSTERGAHAVRVDLPVHLPLDGFLPGTFIRLSFTPCGSNYLRATASLATIARPSRRLRNRLPCEHVATLPSHHIPILRRGQPDILHVLASPGLTARDIEYMHVEIIRNALSMIHQAPRWS